MTIAPTSFLPSGISPAASAPASAATGDFCQALGVAIAGTDAGAGAAQPVMGAGAASASGAAQPVTGANAASAVLPGKGIGMDALLSTGVVAPPAGETPPLPTNTNLPLAPGASLEGELGEPNLATSTAVEGDDTNLEPMTDVVELGHSTPAKTPSRPVADLRPAAVQTGSAAAGQSTTPPTPTIPALQAVAAADVSEAPKNVDDVDAGADDEIPADAPATSATSSQPASIPLAGLPVTPTAAQPLKPQEAPQNPVGAPARGAQSAVTATARSTNAAVDAADNQAVPGAGFADRLAAQTNATAPAPRQEAAAAATGVLPAAQIGTDSAPSLGTAPAAAHAVKPQEVPSVAAQSGRIGHEMGVHIARRVVDGGNELTVRLNPAEMGRVEVRIAFDDTGTLRATVAAERPAALDLLRRDSADLGRALNDAGVRADGQSFRFDTRAGTGDGQAWQRNGGQQDGGRQQQSGGRGYSGEVPADEPVYRALRTSGRVDLMA